MYMTVYDYVWQCTSMYDYLWLCNDLQVTICYISHIGRTNLFHIWGYHNLQRQFEVRNLHGYLESSVLKRILIILYSMLAKKTLNLCLQVLKSSDVWFRLADSGWKRNVFFNVFLVDYVYVCLFEPLVVLEEHMPNSYIIF